MDQVLFNLGLDNWEVSQQMMMRWDEVSLRQQHEQKQGGENLAD